MAGCAALERNVPWRRAGVARSKGCGAAMRAAPIGLYFADDEPALVRVAAAQSALTHRHPTAIASSVAAAAAVAHALRHRVAFGMLDFTRACVARVDASLLESIGCESELAREIGAREMLSILDAVDAKKHVESDDVCELLGGAWVGDEAVATALWCVLRAKDFRDAVTRGASSSGDSDSIACIAGSIFGAMVGVDRLDAGWVSRIEKRALLDDLACALHRGKTEGDTPTTDASLDPYGAEARASRAQT
jgi:ADP-ribosylglycohydrolase